MGGGMIMIDCPHCNGLGYLSSVATEGDSDPDKIGASAKAAFVIDRRSRTYREAIAKIVETHSCSRDEAAMIFDEEFDKL